MSNYPNLLGAEMFSEPIYGIVDKVIVQNRISRVKFNGSYWFARFYDPAEQHTFVPGERVRIVAIQGITLFIAPIDESKKKKKKKKDLSDL